MTPLPWKKSCKWKATDLFVGSGLILKDSLSTKHPKNIDNKCKLQYNQILDHENLFSEKRLVLEGDPGCGKTMLTAQLAYDWSKDKLQNVDILIWLPLNFVKEKTLVEAIKDFYIPESIPLSKDEIEKVLSNESMVITVLLDGLEEYSCNVKDDDASELMKVFSGGKHSNWKVVLTCRSDYARNLPACPRLQVGLFGDEERTEYIKRLCKGDTEMQNELEIIIKNNPLIHDLCSVPLLFVLAVHNIEATKTMKEGQCKRVGPFMKSMISTMIAKETPEGNVVGQSSEYPSIELLHLGEVAFNGLCMGHQKLMWERQFLESNVENCRDWINSGVLTIEEVHFSTKLNEEAELERNKVQTYDEVATVEEDDSRVSEKTELKENFTYLEQNTKENAESRVMHTEKTSIFETSHAVVGENYPITEENSSSLETKPKNMHTGKGYLSRKYVPQGVKFLHKVIQEWFAASYFSHMMKKCHNKLHYSKFIFESLLRIDPVDLHYVLRFSCFLHPPFCHSVMTHLLQQYRADGIVPDYIMDVVFLCFAEQNDSQRTDIEHVVSKLCKNDIVIGYRDGRLLQQAKAKLLEFASSRKIVIERVVLPVLLSDVTENGITLSSGERIGILDTLRKVEVDSWEPQPNEEHLKDMVEFFSRSQQIMEICCVIPSPPPSNITDVTKSRLYAKKITVKWKIGEVIHTFNARKGTWMCKTRIQPSEYRMEGGKNSDPLQASAAVCQDGCLLTVPGTGVALNIPPNAFSDGKKHHVTLRILPHQIFDECSFVDQSTVMVEILPNKLTLQEDAKLILPHCLEIHNPEECPVQVLQSHHDPGTEPKWEDISKSVTFTLREHFCEIFINTFCWITYKLADGTKVKGKRIVVYATGDVPTFQGHRRNCAKIDVGYYPDLASEGKMFRLNRGDITVRQTLMFLREPTTGLQITLTEINPDWWTSKATKKMIEYAEIANSNEMRQSFILNTEESDASPLSCFFEVAKGGRSAELCIILKVLSEGLTSGDWKIVGRFLGLDEGDLDHISSDNPNNLREMKYKMLMKWKQKEGHEATYELLEKALRKAERVDLANKVSTLQG